MTESSSRPNELGVLGTGPVGVSSPGEVAEARQRLLPWLEEQVSALPAARRRARQRRRLRTYGTASAAGLLAAAAVGLILSGAFEPPPSAPPFAEATEPPQATVVSGRIFSESVERSNGQILQLEGALKTSKTQGGAFAVARGYQVELAPDSVLTFHDDKPKQADKHIRLHLRQGIAKFSVLPLPAGSTLSVVTEDAVVTVVGTAFTVEAPSGEPTCVRVAEGRVSVKRGHDERVLQANEDWGCSPESQPEVEEPQPSPREEVRAVGTTLAQENALLTKALAAESRGDSAAAERAYRTLLAKYPRSSFAQDARAGLERLERSTRKE